MFHTFWKILTSKNKFTTALKNFEKCELSDDIKTSINYVLNEKAKYFMIGEWEKRKFKIFLKNLDNEMLQPIKHLKL